MPLCPKSISNAAVRVGLALSLVTSASLCSFPTPAVAGESDAYQRYNDVQYLSKVRTMKRAMKGLIRRGLVCEVGCTMVRVKPPTPSRDIHVGFDKDLNKERTS